jgi:hypothetical protein
MSEFQIWLVRTLGSAEMIPALMNSAWGWPIAESVHFIGVSLLVGTIGVFDLRLIGLARGVSIAALHKLIPWGIAGYAINAATGAMFLVTAPDQYILNPAFQLKLLFMAVAGFNALTFYLVAYRDATAPGASEQAPRSAKIVAAVSLCMWVGVIICGRMITFYRPGPCGPEGPGFLADCFP